MCCAIFPFELRWVKCIEQRYCLKFCSKLRELQAQTLNKIQKVFGDDITGKTNKGVVQLVQRWSHLSGWWAMLNWWWPGSFTIAFIVHHEYAAQGETFNKGCYLWAAKNSSMTMYLFIPSISSKHSLSGKAHHLFISFFTHQTWLLVTFGYFQSSKQKQKKNTLKGRRFESTGDI